MQLINPMQSFAPFFYIDCIFLKGHIALLPLRLPNSLNSHPFDAIFHRFDAQH